MGRGVPFQMLLKWNSILLVAVKQICSSREHRVHKNNITRIEENYLFLLNIPEIPIFKLIQTTEFLHSCARISFPLI